MKLYLLSYDTGFARNIFNFSRRHRIREVTTNGTNYTTSIMITDGTPDDIITFILARNLNGNYITSIKKSLISTRYGSLTEIFEDIGSNINKILIVIDQEEDPLTCVYNQISDKLSENGVLVTNIENHGEKVRIYECTKGPREFNIIVVVNGCTEVNTIIHCIEDHLVNFAGIPCNRNSKDTWNTLTSDQREDIFIRLLNSGRRELERVFPQQITALRLLRT